MENTKTNQDTVIKKQMEFIESFKTMMGFENSQMTNSIVSPISNRIGVVENRIKSLEIQLANSCKENENLKQKLEEYQKITENAKALLDKRQIKIEEILKAIGNVCQISK